MYTKFILHICINHDDVIKWKHFRRNWPFVRGIHRSQVNSPHKGQWCGAFKFSLVCAWINGEVNHRKAGDLRCRHAHYGIDVMPYGSPSSSITTKLTNSTLCFVRKCRDSFYGTKSKIKSNKKHFHYVKRTEQLSFKTKLPKGWC